MDYTTRLVEICSDYIHQWPGLLVTGSCYLLLQPTVLMVAPTNVLRNYTYASGNIITVTYSCAGQLGCWDRQPTISGWILSEYHTAVVVAMGTRAT